MVQMEIIEKLNKFINIGIKFYKYKLSDHINNNELINDLYECLDKG